MSDTATASGHLTPEDLYRFRLIRECRVSPDARHVVVSLERFDRDKRRAFQNLWLVPMPEPTDRRAQPRPFTVGDHRDGSPRWSPDGSRLAFVSNRLDKKARLFLIPADGGEAAPLTPAQLDGRPYEGDISHPCWSPDGRHIAYEFLPADGVDGELIVDGEDGKPDRLARHVTRLSYLADGKGWLPRQRRQIHVVEVATGAVRALTDGQVAVGPASSSPFDHSDPCWSPNGAELVCCAVREVNPELNSGRVDLWRVRLAGGPLVLIPTPAGPKEKPSWSPNGNGIAYIGHDDPDSGWGERNNRLWVVAPDGSGCRCLTPRLDRPVGNITIGDLTGLPDSVPPIWNADSSALLFQVSEDGHTDLYTVELSGDSPPTKLASRGKIFDVSALVDSAAATSFGTVVIAVSDPVRPTVLERSDGKTLFDPNAELLAQTGPQRPTLLAEREPSFSAVPGWLMLPPGFDPSRRYPAILQIHGGPRTQYGHVFMHEFQCLAAAGYVVMYTNPRGSQGYGEAHAAAIRDAWGTVDFDDVMAAADHLAGLGFVDPARLGVIGGSYGGFMVNWVIGHTDRFAAAVSDRCVSNLVSFFGSSDIGWELRREFFRRWPWQDTATLWQRSPMAYADKFKTPTLLVHSEQDLRCPLEQAQQVFTALQANGVPSEMLIFPDESHGMSRGGRPDRRVLRLRRILAWFDRFLKPRRD